MKAKILPGATNLRMPIQFIGTTQAVFKLSDSLTNHIYGFCIDGHTWFVMEHDLEFDLLSERNAQ